jgi:TRAP-type C4-dicarboxylate transport system permease small subunit
MRRAISGLKACMDKALEVTLILAVGLLVIDVVWGVFTRYAMGQQANWTEELARFLLIWVSLLGGAVAFGTKGHLGVDYFVGKFHPDVRKVVAVLGHLVVLFFAGAIFLYGGFQVVRDALTMEQMTPALGWKMGYVYLALPIAGVFMVLYSIENLLETVTTPAAKFDEPALPIPSTATESHDSQTPNSQGTTE